MSTALRQRFTTNDKFPATLSFRPQDAEHSEDLKTLRQSFEDHLKPTLGRRAAATILKYYTALNHWERITHDPPVCEINDDLLRDFMDQLARETSEENAASNYTAIRPILRRIGPRERGNPAAKGIIREVPYCEPFTRKKGKKRVLSTDELDAFYRHCSAAIWPRDNNIPAPLWWRTMAVIDATIGMRIGDLVKQSRQHLGLKWESVHFNPQCPDMDLPWSNPHGWLVFTPKKTRNSKPEPLYIPLTAACAAHLKAIEELCPRHAEESLILPAGIQPKAFKRERLRICKAAGIRPFVPKNFRHTANNAWNMVLPGLGRHVLGHAARDVNEGHYSVWVGQLVQAVDKLQFPSVFTTML